MDIISIVENLGNSPVIMLSGFIIGAVALVGMIIIWYISKKEKKPVYTIGSHNLIQDFSSKLSNLVIHYNDENVKNLTVSKISFWNEGRDTINYADIAPVKPIIIASNEGIKILEISIIYSIEPANRFQLIEIERYKQYNLTFDYVDKNQGVVIQVVHDGKGDNIKLTGLIKGTYGIKYRKLKVVHRVRVKRLPGGAYLRFSDRILGYLLFFLFSYPLYFYY